MPEILAASGYATAMFVSHGLVGPELGFGQGFDHVELHEVPSHLPGHRHRADDEEIGPLDGVFRAASRWIEQAGSEPFFVWLHVQHPHKSYEPPAPYDTAFGPTGSDATICAAATPSTITRKARSSSPGPNWTA